MLKMHNQLPLKANSSILIVLGDGPSFTWNLNFQHNLGIQKLTFSSHGCLPFPFSWFRARDSAHSSND